MLLASALAGLLLGQAESSVQLCSVWGAGRNLISPLPLQVMESVVKNCGQTVHDEVANKQTMEELKEILKVALVICLALEAAGGTH